MPKDHPAAPVRGQRTLRLARGVLFALREAGVDVDALARQLGVASATARLTEPQAEALMDQALALIPDPAFGLSRGAKVRPELFGLPGFAAMTAPTLGEAMVRLARYKRLLSTDFFEIARSSEGLAVKVRLSRPDAPHARLRADADLAFIVSFGRLLTQAPLRPLRVSVRGPQPGYHEQYLPLFGCPVHFGEALDEVMFSAADAARPVAGSSPEVVGLLEACAEQLLAEYDGESIIEQVRAALRRQMDGAALSLAQMARTLGISARSLQRRLAEAGTTFAALLSEVRREVACERLARGDTEVAALSFLLGFSDPNSFYRAFKRWEGMTPQEYRSASREAMGRAEGAALSRA